MSVDGKYTVRDLLRVMQRLRDPRHGCPWDLSQDFDTIVPSTLEECYELVAAIEQGDYPHLAEELGDLLFQVVFYAQLGDEKGLFDFPQVVNTLVEKLLRRHPHVFAGGEIEGLVEEAVSMQQVHQSWEDIKQQERTARQQPGTLADVPLSLPALSRAQKVQKRAALAGLDWDAIDAVINKVEEELQEFSAALVESHSAQEDELGDLLFTCVNLARHAGIDSEAALRRATSKFEGRVTRLELKLETDGMEMNAVSAAVLDEYWNRVKGDVD